MANDNLPAPIGSGVPAVSGELEMADWLKKLKKNQDRKKEEKLKKYNDIISKFIIILVGVCVVCFIAIAALAVENNGLYKQNDQIKANYSSQITKLTSDNNDLRQLLFSNRSSNVLYTINMDPSLPKASKITFDNNRVHFDFVDGTVKDVYYIDSNLYVNSK